MVHKGGEKLTYKAGQIVLLTILLKNRLFIEATRLPCRISQLLRVPIPCSLSIVPLRVVTKSQLYL